MSSIFKAIESEYAEALLRENMGIDDFIKAMQDHFHYNVHPWDRMSYWDYDEKEHRSYMYDIWQKAYLKVHGPVCPHGNKWWTGCTECLMGLLNRTLVLPKQ